MHCPTGTRGQTLGDGLESVFGTPPHRSGWGQEHLEYKARLCPYRKAEGESNNLVDRMIFSSCVKDLLVIIEIDFFGDANETRPSRSSEERVK